jgi:hypothetical protein
MKWAIFPTAVGVLVLGGWLAVTLIEDCLLTIGDPKFDCWTSLQLVTVFASISAVLAMIAAGLARAALHRFLPIRLIAAELISAALSSVALVLMFYGFIHWQVLMGGAAGIFFGWLFSTFVLCGTSLIAVHHFTSKPSTE